MNTDAVFRLDTISLQNFRCFEQCTVELHPKLTVFVAENGKGKTAILEAIGVALRPFVATITQTKEIHGFRSLDIRIIHEQEGMIPVLPTGYTAKGAIAGEQIRWAQNVREKQPRLRASTRDALALIKAAEQWSEKMSVLPLLALYGAGRIWSEAPDTYRRERLQNRTREGRFEGYTDCFSASSSVKDLITWYESVSNTTRDPRYASDLKNNLALLTAVREATRIVLEPTGWYQLDWDYEQQQLAVEHVNGRRLPLGALSDGVRNMIALVADIARRCATLNPHLGEGAAKQTPGILLIDEVDAHLHPGWQQQVVGLLCKAFPALQIILSTHSPHVLSTIDKESIRIVRLQDGNGQLAIPELQTRGVESADVLALIMGVDPIPHIEEAQWLSDYRALVQTQNHETDEGRQLWGQLVSHFGEYHPVIVEVEVLRRFQGFKKQHGLPSAEAN